MSNKPNEKMDGVIENPSDKSRPGDKPARPPKIKKTLGRETKVGLGVIGALLVIFVIVLVVRLSGGSDDDLAKQDSGSVERSPSKDQEKSKSAASPQAAPKVITAKSGDANATKYFGGGTGGTPDKSASRSVYGGSAYSNNNDVMDVRATSPGYLPPGTQQSGTAGETATARSTGATHAEGALENPLRAYAPGNPFNDAADRQPDDSLPGSKSDSNKLPHDLSARGASADQTSFGSNSTDPFNRSKESGPSLRNGFEMNAAQPDRTAGGQNPLGNPGEQIGRAGFDETAPKSARANSFKDDAVSQETPFSTPEAAEPSGAASSKLKLSEHSASNSFQPKFTPPSQRGGPRAPDSRATSAPPFGDTRQPLAATELDEPAAASQVKPPATLKTGEETANGELYTVQTNDTYWKIAEKSYGSGAYFKALYEHNRRRLEGADSLRAGVQLVLPDEATLRRLYPALCPRPTKLAAAGRATRASATAESNEHAYVVREGDTLYEIARRQLGKPARWAEVYELNRDAIGDATDRLEPGTRLVLPEDAGSTGR